jgi:Na+-transporting methylmalonyl-CoA/oxaloacetate decarboxylase gamma subunit
MILAFTNRPDLFENLEFQLLGAAVVFGALGLLWLGLELTGTFFRRMDRRPPSSDTPPPPSNPSPSDDTIPEEIVAVVAAAIHATLGGNIRITRIQSTPEQQSFSQLCVQTWSHEGRRQIFNSHRPR